jgi:hypothetical protein
MRTELGAAPHKHTVTDAYLLKIYCLADVRPNRTKIPSSLRSGVLRFGLDRHLHFSPWLQSDLVTILVS